MARHIAFRGADWRRPQKKRAGKRGASRPRSVSSVAYQAVPLWALFMVPETELKVFFTELPSAP
ncbi:MAG: hypothetical protein KGL48_14685, partial [Sphingomonadales bacterium]|nr:hypothetical protein [Sphingomonadales bacterium]